MNSVQGNSGVKTMETSSQCIKQCACMHAVMFVRSVHCFFSNSNLHPCKCIALSSMQYCLPSYNRNHEPCHILDRAAIHVCLIILYHHVYSIGWVLSGSGCGLTNGSFPSIRCCGYMYVFIYMYALGCVLWSIYVHVHGNSS